MAWSGCQIRVRIARAAAAQVKRRGTPLVRSLPGLAGRDCLITLVMLVKHGCCSHALPCPTTPRAALVQKRDSFHRRPRISGAYQLVDSKIMQLLHSG